MNADAHPSLNGRAGTIAVAGWAILGLSAGGAILPLLSTANSALLVGSLLILAGLIEIWAGSLRHQTRKLAMLAGAITTLTGFLFGTDPGTHFLPAVYIIMGWLVLRSLVLAFACRLETGSVRLWTGLSAGMDLLLAVTLVVGLSIATLVVTLFGPTPELIASFAWVLALSFVVTGLMLLEVAGCARDAEDV